MNSEILFWGLPLVLLGVLLLIILTLLLSRQRKLTRTPVDSESFELIRRISRRLDALEEIGGKIEGLDRAFRIPRIRGGLGESLLEELLRNWLPRGAWTPQFAFPNGTRADAVIRMGSSLVAVDAKFPLEQLGEWLESEKPEIPAKIRRLLIGYAGDIAEKYIQPEAGTLSFALLYLPAEGLYYRLLQDDSGEVLRECLRLGVIPVGPTSLFAYLQTVAYGLKGFTPPREGRELRQRVEQLRRDFMVLTKLLSTASTHMKNLKKAWEAIDHQWNRTEYSLEVLDSRDTENL